jgi:ATP-binding cassette subfamily F protein 3
MATLTVSNLAKSFGGHVLFAGVQFDAPEMTRLAVVGPNGAGKSTFLRIVSGHIDPDEGRVALPKGSRIGFTTQELTAAELDTPLLRYVLDVLPSWGDFWERWEEALSREDHVELERLAHEQAELERAFGYNPEYQARAVLHGLGFADEQFERGLRTLSGGWRERAKLARVLLAGADVLLLDEPTNHLDLEAVEWLEEYLKNYRGVLLFVAHDRIFLDNVATHVLALDDTDPLFRRGNFSDYLDYEAEREERRAKEAEKIQAKISHHQDYIRRFRVKARKAAQAQSKIKQVEKLEKELSGYQPKSARRTLSFSLPEAPRADKTVIAASELGFGFPDKEPLFKDLDFTVLRGQKITLAAPNGAGKSTLLKLAVGALKPTSGSITLGPKTKLGYFSQHQAETLNLANTVVSELSRLSDPNTTREELMSVLGLFMLGEEYFERPVSKLSGGEKSRLALAALFLGRCNLLVMDEPTNHLDLESREALVDALKDYDGTLFFVAHDRYLMTEVAQECWALSQSGIERYLGGFPEYERKHREELAAPQPKLCKPKESGEAQGNGGKAAGKLSKEEKRRQAEIRNRISRELKPKRNDYEKVEAELSGVMEELERLERKMADPETYARQDLFTELSKTYAAAKAREESLFERLGELEEAIQALEAEKERLLAC